ncbi:MAG: hypothetical protein H6836_02060 [Planctomycetes bacterium]|nr:hypothetical protein [Planctomycetota bacterium]MCB9888332.1 hypothetical protein [Planctomycetota bacterium]
MNRSATLHSLLSILFTWSTAAAQSPTPRLLVDTDLRPAAVVPPSAQGFLNLGAYTYFAATDALHGRELFRCRGHAAPAELVADVLPGMGSSEPADLTVVGSLLYFSADDGRHGRELWVTDGTAQGTRLVVDLVVGPLGSVPQGLARGIGATVLFWAYTAATGRELFVSDGTALGTKLVVDLTTGATGTEPGPILTVGGVGFFSTGPGNLYATDGTAPGTKQLVTLTNVQEMAALGSKLLFFASQDPSGSEPWVSDGTAAGTTLLKDVHPGPGGSGSFLGFRTAGDGFLVVGSRAFFPAHKPQGGIWSTDGTAQGTVEVAGAPQSWTFQSLRSFGGRIWFVSPALGGVLPLGMILWRSEGTQSSTVPVAYFSEGDHLPQLEVAGSRMYFHAATKTEGMELWSSDGTVAGTRIVRDLAPGPAGSFDGRSSGLLHADSGGGLLFNAGTSGGAEVLYGTDGTTAGTQPLKGIGQPPLGATRGAEVLELKAAAGLMWFRAGDALWRSDRSASGTFAVGAKLGPGASRAEVPDDLSLVGIGQRALFRGWDPAHGYELWSSDGTTAGTSLVEDSNPGPADGLLTTGFARSGDEVYYLATSSDQGAWQLRATDGVGPSRMLARYPTYYSEFRLSALGRVDGRQLLGTLAWYESDLQQQVWSTDGTAGGTKQHFSAYQNFGRYRNLAPQPETFVELGGLAVFLTLDSFSTSYPSLYLTVSDGKSVQKLNVTTQVEGPVVELAGRAFFLRASALFATDGTQAGTGAVWTSANELGASGLSRAGDRLFFSTNTLTYEPGTSTYLGTASALWRSDGTTAGTVRVSDLAGPIEHLTAIGEHVWFTTDAGLWTSDGTAAGTQLVTDALRVRAAVADRGTLWLAADDGVHGLEVHVIGPLPHAQDLAGACGRGSGPRLRGTTPQLGRDLRLSLTGGVASALGLVWLGAPQQPVNLGAGCELHVAPGQVVSPVRCDSSGTWTATLPVPDLPALRGLRVHAQVGLGSTSQPPLGVDFSNGLSLGL